MGLLPKRMFRCKCGAFWTRRLKLCAMCGKPNIKPYRMTEEQRDIHEALLCEKFRELGHPETNN